MALWSYLYQSARSNWKKIKSILIDQPAAVKVQPVQELRSHHHGRGRFFKMVLRFLLLSAGLWRSISQFWGFLKANITFSSRCTAEAGSALLSCLLQPFPADLHAVRAGRRQLVVARCHAKLWPLSVRSHQASRAGARSHGRFPARLSLQRGIPGCKCAKTARKQRVGVESRTAVFGSFGRLPSSLHLHRAPLFLPPWTRGRCRA